MARIEGSLFARVSLFLIAAGFGMAAGGQEGKRPQVGEKKPPEVVSDNKNTLIQAHRNRLRLSCSTFYNGWPVEKLIDGNAATSWFSATGDAAAKGTKPWVQLTFPEDVTVARVTVLGNREPPWQKGYTILNGMIEFLDADGKQLWVDENTGVGNESDFEFKPKKPMAKVRSIKFTSLKDQGDQNPFLDIGIGEIQVE